MAENKLHIDMAELDSAWEKGAAAYIRFITDSYLEVLGGGLNAENMEMLNADQHTLLAYRFVLDEVMEGGFIQLLHNGYGPYILENPFPYTMKQWGLRDFSKLLYEVKKLYHIHREELEADIDEETFMALYEKLEKLNDAGDDFLDDFQEETTPYIAQYVRDNIERFI